MLLMDRFVKTLRTILLLVSITEYRFRLLVWFNRGCLLGNCTSRILPITVCFWDKSLIIFHFAMLNYLICCYIKRHNNILLEKYNNHLIIF
jgi:hypothetical protein